MINYPKLGEVAERLGVSEKQVRVLIQAGELRAVLTSASRNSKKPRYAIPPAALEDFEWRRSTMPAPTASPRAKARKREDVPQYV